MRSFSQEFGWVATGVFSTCSGVFEGIVTVVEVLYSDSTMA